MFFDSLASDYQFLMKNCFPESRGNYAQWQCQGKLWAHATEERFAWHHHWRLGDVILWDNRVTLYRRTTFDPNERRIMHRTQIRSSLFGY